VTAPEDSPGARDGNGVTDSPPRTAGRPPATYISDLRPSRVASFDAVVARLEPVREVETKAGVRRSVRDATLSDATGEITLVLWGSEVDRLTVGERVRIVDGWVSERRGRSQITLGRTGRIEPAAP
jgi:hypothetical protein